MSQSIRAEQRQRKAAGTSAPPGVPAALTDAKRVLVILDAPARATAKLAGHGNTSEGIRLALQAWDAARISPHQI